MDKKWREAKDKLYILYIFHYFTYLTDPSGIERNWGKVIFKNWLNKRVNNGLGEREEKMSIWQEADVIYFSIDDMPGRESRCEKKEFWTICNVAYEIAFRDRSDLPLIFEQYYFMLLIQMFVFQTSTQNQKREYFYDGQCYKIIENVNFENKNMVFVLFMELKYVEVIHCFYF